jgi:hypothetical protein
LQLDLEKESLLHDSSVESMFDRTDAIHDKHAIFIKQVEEEFG